MERAVKIYALYLQLFIKKSNIFHLCFYFKFGPIEIRLQVEAATLTMVKWRFSL